MKNLAFIFSILLLFSACSPNTSNRKDSSKKASFIDSLYCKNQLDLIIATDSTPVVNLDFTKPIDSCNKQIEKAFDYDICNKLVYYAIPYDLKTKKIEETENSILLKFRKVKMCQTHYHRSFRYMFNIKMNRKGEIMIDNTTIIERPDSIKELIPYYYFRRANNLSKNKGRVYFYIKWDEQVETQKLTNIFFYIIDGYLDATSEFSKRKYKKTICELNQVELATVKDSIPFQLELFDQNEMEDIELIE